MSNSTAIANWDETARPQLKVAPERRSNHGMRQLYWLYFWLLIFEGVLRKWVAPSLSAPLLLIRDPIPILMVWLAIRNRVLPRTLAFWLWLMLGIACLIAGLVVLPNEPQIPIYGFRCDFLHLPMLFIAPYILEKADLLKMLRMLVIVSVPIALLMVYQFRSPPGSWINSGLDNSFQQIGSAEGHIRPAGPFSFATGPFCYFTLTSACLIGGAIDHIRFSKALLIAGALALLVAAAFSGSRSLLSGIAVVAAVGMAAAAAVNSKAVLRYVAAVLTFVAIAAGVNNTSMIDDGTHAFSTRITQSAGEQGTVAGLLDRFFGEFIHAGPAAAKAPILGYGLGAGTMGASAMLAGGNRGGFHMDEEEWPRIVEESGPILGFLFIGFRVALTVWVGWIAFLAARRGSALPLCLFGSCAVYFLTGSFGQGTLMGYTMLTGGLCLASVRVAREDSDQVADGTPVPA